MTPIHNKTQAITQIMHSKSEKKGSINLRLVWMEGKKNHFKEKLKDENSFRGGKKDSLSHLLACEFEVNYR